MSLGYAIGYLIVPVTVIILLYCIIESYAKTRRLNREMKELRLRVEYLEKNK